MVEIFTDGACRGNPGPGGWGVLIRRQDGDIELKGGERETTNNRMELMAAIKALEYFLIPENSTAGKLRITTDSKYVMQGLTEWMPNWKRKGWRTSAGKPVKNQDLWQRLDQLAQKHDLRWQWVRGHQGHVENERADQLANLAIDELLA